MIKKQYIEDKIFVTGISGAGKTQIAQFISKNAHPTTPHPYLPVDYDFADRYNNEEQYVKEYFNNLPKRFVMDGIPYKSEGISMNLDSFKEYYKSQSIKILCLVPTNFLDWKKRIVEKNQFIGYACLNFAIFYYKILPQLEKMNIDYYDTYNNKFISIEKLYREIKWVEPILNFI